MHTLKISSRNEFEISDSRQTRELKDLRKPGCTSSVSDKKVKAGHHVQRQHSVVTHECIYQTTLAKQKMTSNVSSMFKSFKFSYAKDSSFGLVEKSATDCPFELNDRK